MTPIADTAEQSRPPHECAVDRGVRLRRHSITGALVALSLAAAAGGGQEAAVPAPGGARVVAVRVEPESHRGPCPVSLRFTGEIEKGAWGLVEYHWVRSDGSRTPSVEIDFPIQGEFRGSPVERVAMSWSVEPASGEEVWAELVIDSPPPATPAARAVARVSCTGAGPAADPCAELTELGPITSLVRQCAERRIAEAEAELREVVKRFESTLRPSRSATGDSTERSLRQIELRRADAFRSSQTTWEQFRHQACEEVYLETFPGSSATARRLECLRELTEERRRQLERRLSPEE
jgi:uncharacterized protein YecT (DUF1311 family)